MPDAAAPSTLKSLLPEREAAIVVAWLRGKAEQYGDVSLRNLAMYAEDGQA